VYAPAPNGHRSFRWSNGKESCASFWDLFKEVCQRNLEGIVAKRKSGTYSTISGWLKIKNPNYTQSEQRHELFESFKAKTVAPRINLPPIPKKPPRRAITSLTTVRKSRSRARRTNSRE
jgi:hypothetical protein